MKNIFFRIILATFVFSPLANASVDQKLVDYFLSRMSEVQSSVATCSYLNLGPMALSDINLDLTPSVNFGISGVLNVTVAPEIDFVFVPSTNSP